jgi:hypothetical protein
MSEHGFNYWSHVLVCLLVIVDVIRILIFFGNEQVFVSHSSGSSIAQVNIQINYSSDSLLLHWGVVRDRKE